MGGERVIRESLPILFVEIVYSLKKRYLNKNYKQTLDFINNLGYKIFYLENSKLIEVKDISKSKGVKMYLCLHSVKHNLFLKEMFNKNEI